MHQQTTINIDEPHWIEDNDKTRILTILNNHFANYLDKIRELGNKNIYLRQQIVSVNEKYTGYMDEKSNGSNNYNSLEIELNNLRRQFSQELRQLISEEFHFQRADYDRKYYKNQIRLFSESDSSQIIIQQLDANLYELNLLKQQYEKEEQELLVNSIIIIIHYRRFF